MPVKFEDNPETVEINVPKSPTKSSSTNFLSPNPKSDNSSNFPSAGSRRASVASLFAGDAIKQVETEIFQILKGTEDSGEDGINAQEGSVELRAFLGKLESNGIFIEDVRLDAMRKAIDGKFWDYFCGVF